MLNKDSHKVIGHIIANCILFSYVQGGRGGVVLLFLVTGQGEAAWPGC